MRSRLSFVALLLVLLTAGGCGRSSVDESDDADLAEETATEVREPNVPFIRCPGGYLQALAFSPDGAWVAAAYFDSHQQRRTVGVWDAHSLGPIFTDWEKAGYRGFEALAFSPDKKQLVALGDSHDRNEWIAWDTASGKRTQERGRPRERHDPNLLHGYPTRELLWAADGRWLLHDAVAGLVTDLATGETVQDYDQTLVGRKKDIFGGVIIVAASGGPRMVYDAVTGKLLHTHPAIKGGAYNCCDFSQDGTTRCVCPRVDRFTVTKSTPAAKCVFRFDIKCKAPDGIRRRRTAAGWRTATSIWRRGRRSCPPCSPKSTSTSRSSTRPPATPSATPPDETTATAALDM